MTKKKKLNIKLPSGELIQRVPTFHPFGNFIMTTVRYKNERFLIGDGDEYIRGGYDKVFTLGKKIEW